MKIIFDEVFRLPAEQLYSYFETPADWARIFGMSGVTKALEDDWYAVGLKRFPFPLVARNTHQEANRSVAWTFRGFWRGRGEVHFVTEGDSTWVRGFEEISARPLFFLSPIFEWLLFERTFKTVWNVGWYRLHKMEQSLAESHAHSKGED